MLSLRTTPLLFVLLLVGAGSLAGQRSLYQDALAIADYKKARANKSLKDTVVITAWVVPAKPKGELPRVQIGGPEGPYLSEAPVSISLEREELYVRSAHPFDKIIIKIGSEEIRVALGYAPDIRSFLSLPNLDRRAPIDGGTDAMFIGKILVEYEPKKSAPDYASYTISAYEAPEVGNTFKFYASYFYYTPVRPIESSVVLRLKQHNELVNRSDFYGLGTIDLSTAYANNPFFHFQDIAPLGDDYLYFHLNNYYGGVEGEMYNAFPFQKILAGDSTLNNAIPEVGLDDTESYRQRIVTAQNRLEAANVALDNQRKKGGLLDANTIAVGLSDFIAERAQEELNLTFFNRFKENLARDSELTVLFPTTKDLLMKFEISNYKVFLAHARETFNADLDRLGINLSGVLDLPKYQRLNNDPDVFNLALIYDIANAAYQEKSVEEIILTTHQELQQRQVNLSESINLAIADTVSGSATEAGGQASAPDFAFRKHIAQYIGKVQEVSLRLNNVVADFYEPTGDPLYLIFRDRIPTYSAVNSWSDPSYGLPREVVALRDTLVESKGHLTEKNTEVARRLATAGGYNGSRASGSDRTSTNHHGTSLFFTSFVEHSRNVIPAFLEGHDYYGYYFDERRDFSRQQLQNIPEDAPTEYLARGLERARSFLGVPFDDFTRNHLKEIEAAKREVESVMREDFDSDITEDYFYSIINNLQDAALALKSKMEVDLEALSSATGKRIEADRSLAELELLRQEYAAKFVTAGQWEKLENVDFLYVKNSFGEISFVTLISMQTGANSFLDGYEHEWNTLLARALARHKLTTTSAGIPTEYPEVYVTARQTINDLEPETTQLFTDIDRTLQQIDTEISELGAIRKRLQKELDALELSVAPELVKARSNARELAKAVELSAHILFSFRDYEQVYDTLYYQDTQRVEITVQNTDPKNGLLRTYKKDSLVVERTPVPGTTAPLTVGKWISRQQFDALRKDKETWNIFLGLLYQRLSAVEDGPQFSARGVATLATRFLDIANEIQDTQDELRFKKGTAPRSVGLKDYFPYIRSTVDLLNIVLTTPVSGDSTAISKRANALGNITEISNEALSLYENIDVRDYGNAILNATELLRIITNREYTKEELDAMGKDERKRRARSQRQIAAVFNYGTFMAEMINAKSSQQVQTILKSTTLPPGSSRIKREVQSNVTINSYLGAGLGRDRLLDAPTDIDADAFGAALSVPIGITYSFSPKFLRNRSSFSIHVPLLDLGAITAYRSNPNGQTANVDALPELEWKNLFSPGAYLIYNFADSPFSLGIGGQYGPQLRELNQANGEPIFLNSFRFPMISATIDVPFYNLHTGPRKIVVK